MEQLSNLFSNIRYILQNLELSSLSSQIKELTQGNLPDQIPGKEQMMETASSALHTISTGFLLVGLIIALLGCFFGYKMLKFWISLAGLIIGAACGYGILYYFVQDGTYAMIGAGVGAVLGAILSYKIYLLGVFILFGAGTYFLCAASLSLDGMLLTAASFILAVIVAVLAVIYMRPAIIVITGLQNGLIISGCLLKLVPDIPSSMSIPIGVGVAVAGMAFQFLTTRTKKEKQKRKALEDN